jgi:hypothetical protein
MKVIIYLGFVFVSSIRRIHSFSVVTRPATRKYDTQKQPERTSSDVLPLLSARNVNENGEYVSDLQSSLTSIDGNPMILSRNETDDDDDEGTSVMSSVTHWSDIMRQDSWPQQHVAAESISSTTAEVTSSTTTSTLRIDDTALCKAELDQIEEYWDRLMPTVSYLGTVQVAKIYKALRVAYVAHRGQMRKSGEPFIVHVSRTESFWFIPISSFFNSFLPLIGDTLSVHFKAVGSRLAAFRSKDGC